MKDFIDKSKNPIASMVNEALQNVKTLVDVDTIVGNPIKMGDDVITYPLIKITLGVVAGGGEYSSKMIVRKTGTCYPFIGGTGAGFTAEPIGFLVVSQNEPKLITIENKNAWAKVISKVGDGLSDYLKNIAKQKFKRGKDDEKSN